MSKVLRLNMDMFPFKIVSISCYAFLPASNQVHEQVLKEGLFEAAHDFFHTFLQSSEVPETLAMQLFFELWKQSKVTGG